MKKNLLPMCMVLFLAVGCAKNSLSERDVRRSQLANAAEIKRKELMLVAGTYEGLLTANGGTSQRVSLFLEIKDIPSQVEGQVDPLMMPILTGYLRLSLGSQLDPAEFVSFSVQKGEFDPSREKLDLVLTHQEYKELIVGVNRRENNLSGSWTAPGLSSSGSIELARSK